MKICVLGAGALGSTFGAWLSEAGHDTWLLNRPNAHIQAIRHAGLAIEAAEGNRVVQVQAADDANAVGVVDLVVVLVKSFATVEAMTQALALVGTQTLVLSLQNGLGHEELLAEIVGREQVIAGKTYVGGVLLGPGRIRSGVAGKQTIIGELDGQLTPRVQAVADAFAGAGLATTVSGNILGTLWDKLQVNVATGALTGITQLTYGQLYSEPLLRDTALQAVAEVIAVARAAGVELGLKEPEAAWQLAREGLPPSFKTSMLQSLQKGSITEIDFINGAVVRLGQQYRVPTPVNATLVACIKGIERALADRQQEDATP
ncbi:ketopantoate reductase family protein [Pseudomonas oryzihabitans]|uniref:ketopantoate reductase family protein n=1 Tax=Pseudomonas oryzihabitans TaxID=47885 RepID=UPI002860BC7D|nr:ketopantoate reductase family protein [Pseudomonas psychrotolerans]MDR6675873.1 2-dehydropantoate 2-reductase [Pseudomonas psychrotolerans]